VWKKSTSSPEDDEWYFSPPRICTSASASGAPARQHRLTRGGYWKATGKDRAINIEQYFLSHRRGRGRGRWRAPAQPGPARGLQQQQQ